MDISFAAPPAARPPAAPLSPVAKFALAAALTVLAMFGIFAFTGIGQDPLQFVRVPNEYAAILLRNPPVLRAVIGLDNLFIVFYLSLFVALATQLWRDARSRALLSAAFSLLVVAGLLDLAENMHFLVMLAAATQGLQIGIAEIEFQMWESLIKFHISYLGLFLLGFVLSGDGRLENWLRRALCWIQLPVGLAIYLVPKEIAVVLVLVRFAFFLFALLALAAIFRASKSG